MSQKSGWSLLLALAVTMLGAGVARADLGPFPHPRPRPEPQPDSCTTTLVRSVEKAKVEGGSRVVVRGTASTGGWSNGALRFRGIRRNGGPGVAVYEFTGCRPAIATQALTPITAELSVRVASRFGVVGRVLIKAETNSILLDLDARPGH